MANTRRRRRKRRKRCFHCERLMPARSIRDGTCVNDEQCEAFADPEHPWAVGYTIRGRRYFLVEHRHRKIATASRYLALARRYKTERAAARVATTRQTAIHPFQAIRVIPEQGS